MAEKVGAVETAADVFKRRAGAARPQDLAWVLDNAPDVAPVPGDGRN